jgi:hypothetical protein
VPQIQSQKPAAFSSIGNGRRKKMREHLQINGTHASGVIKPTVLIP